MSLPCDTKLSYYKTCPITDNYDLTPDISILKDETKYISKIIFNLVFGGQTKNILHASWHVIYAITVFKTQNYDHTIKFKATQIKIVLILILEDGRN